MSETLPLIQALQMRHHAADDLCGSLIMQLTISPGVSGEEQELLRRDLRLGRIADRGEPAEPLSGSASRLSRMLCCSYACGAGIRSAEHGALPSQAGNERHPFPGQDPRKAAGYCRMLHD